MRPVADGSAALGEPARTVPEGGVVIEPSRGGFITSADRRAPPPAHRTAAAAGGTLVASGIRGPVAEVCRISRCDRLFKVAGPTRDAVALISPAAAEAYPG